MYSSVKISNLQVWTVFHPEETNPKVFDFGAHPVDTGINLQSQEEVRVNPTTVLSQGYLGVEYSLSLRYK